MQLLRPPFYAQERDSSCVWQGAYLDWNLSPGVVLLYTSLI
jgi:hypothetical protein